MAYDIAILRSITQKAVTGVGCTILTQKIRRDHADNDQIIDLLPPEKKKKIILR